MNIVCSKEKLIYNINLVSQTASNRTTMPILECILITANENLKLTANNMETAIETVPIEAGILEKGEIAINAKFFADVIRKLPEEEVIIKVDEKGSVLIKSGKVEFKIMGQKSEDFPRLPDLELLSGEVIEGELFRKMIKQTIFSISTSEDKPTFTGELLEIKNGKIILVAVDNFRVSLRSEDLAAEINHEAIIPGKTMKELSRIIPANSDISIYFTEKYVLIETNEFVITSRLLEGDFLKYNQVFEGERKTLFTINRNEILEALDRAGIIASDGKTVPSKLKIEKEKLIITSNSDMGNLYDEVEIALVGDELEISFNPKFLIEAIKAIESDNISMQFGTSLSPCVIMAENSENYKYLVLPLRMD
ncbi:MAG: DNA polymerase III subunit beta [Defluviitaleaceae bacterium]|nr:DNA polymerase III subunit beta [Defluviitaleaceae bacterium]